MARRRLLGIALLGAFIAIAVQIALLYKNALQDDMRPPEMPPPITCPPLDESAALDRFRRLLTFPTVSNASAPDHVGNHTALRELLASLEQSYPLVWRHMRVERVGAGGYSLLLTWAGRRPGLRPLLFVSHMDVVPVTPGSEGEWRHPPFGGELAEGYVWGRGAADIKFSVAALLEAASGLLRAGYQPERTLMFAFGHDEEVGGSLGAGATSALLSSRGVVLAAVVDEGGLLLADGMRPFTRGRLALVGTAEKGWATLGVTLRSPGGHASMPPTDGSDIHSQMWRLSTAMQLLQPPAVLQPPVTDMLRQLAPHSPAWMRPLLASCEARRSWLVHQLLSRLFRLLGRETAAMVTDTLALTRLRAGVADNVLPQDAHLSFNCRLLPGSAAAGLAERLRWLAGAARVRAEVAVEASSVWPGSRVTPASGRHFALLRRAIQETWRREGEPDLPVVPFLLSGGTDSKHYGNLSYGGILRFVPYALNKTAGDLGLIHGTNERIRAENFGRAVCTYGRMFELFGGMGEEEGEEGKGEEASGSGET